MTVAEQARSKEIETADSELDERIWAVISFERIEAMNLMYPEAVHLVAELEDRGVPGVCIVTNDAASQIKTLK